MFEKKFRVPYYGLDANDHVKTGLLLQFFQEAAALHASTVKIGVGDLLEHGITWVLRRYRVRIHSTPGLGDLTVRTWFEPKRNLMSVREFEIRDTADNVVADAWSSWIVVDLEKGRPVRLDRALPDSYFAATDPTGEPASDHVRFPDNADKNFDIFDQERTFRVRWQELDLNGHTNHTVYFEWAMETLPDGILGEKRPLQLDAEYLHSARREEVICRTKKISEDFSEPLTFAHSIIIKETGIEAARLETRWGS